MRTSSFQDHSERSSRPGGWYVKTFQRRRTLLEEFWQHPHVVFEKNPCYGPTYHGSPKIHFPDRTNPATPPKPKVVHRRSLPSLAGQT